MLVSRFIWVAAATVLTACSGSNELADAVARDTAKSVVTPIVEENLPGTNAVGITDCVIDNASSGEILTLASAAVRGVDQSTVKTVLDIAKRPQAVECIAKVSLSGLVGG